jgi:hypothetical protein
LTPLLPDAGHLDVARELTLQETRPTLASDGLLAKVCGPVVTSRYPTRAARRLPFARNLPVINFAQTRLSQSL